MKRLIALVLGLVVVFFLARPVQASEGQTILEPTTPGGAKCLAFSVYIESGYQTLLTCRNLVTPYSAEITHYMLWANNPEKKKWVSLGYVNQGKLTARTSFRFDDLEVSAEEGSPNQPGEFVVARGHVEPFDFDKRAVAPILTSMPTPTLAAAAVSPTVQGNAVGGIVKSVAKLLVIAFVVLLVGVVVMTFITRRREL